ncbi:MAG: hypothetical protein KF752_15895 [Pirellulaceae bacterium]|nr:hypothetical protein [Pirellulaceae bacterium]
MSEENLELIVESLKKHSSGTVDGKCMSNFAHVCLQLRNGVQVNLDSSFGDY